MAEVIEPEVVVDQPPNQPERSKVVWLLAEILQHLLWLLQALRAGRPGSPGKGAPN